MHRHDPRILVVDDEPDILNLLDYNLRKAGFKVLSAKDGPEAIDTARLQRPDLILLDIMLPDMEGTEVLKRLKTFDSTRHIPVIMLTAKGEEVDKIIGFELGAEDYITKPFSPRELILRVRAVLKRGAEPAEPAGGKSLSFKELSVDLSRHRVTVKGVEVVLSSQEFKLLSGLLGSRGMVLSRDAILDRAWGRDCFVIPRTVDTHVRRLRSKLKSAGKYIETVRGVGYRFREE
ncbi:MAG: response regulator transcription factor [Deltaproteobacteria bacterium]|nr:response regulator transcription factor [Deltaproteobacteria bacterium]